MAWSMGQSIPLTQLKPFCFTDFSAKKSINFTPSVLGFGWIAQGKPAGCSKRSRKKLSLCCRCSDNLSSSLGWDWSRWSRHFAEIEQAESFASVLKDVYRTPGMVLFASQSMNANNGSSRLEEPFQLEDAIEKEDFQEAAKLKLAIAEATSKDSVAEIMFQLKTAIDEERYHDASKLYKHTASGLVGWWVGYTEDSDDPFGRLVHITPGMGRFVGRSYSPRQLVTASPGTPLFEIFVVKDVDETYVMQVVYLQRTKSTSSQSKIQKGPTTSKVDAASVNGQEKEVKGEKSEEKGINIEGATEEGIKSVINFLKDKIPGLKVKVMNVNVTVDDLEDSNSVKQLMQEDDEKMGPSENSEEEADDLEEMQPDEIAVKGGGDSTKEGKDLDMKLFIGGIVHNKDDTPAKDDYVRHPAEIKDAERDSFVLHVPRINLDHDIGESKATKVKVAALAAEGVSELMPSDVAKAFWNVDKISPKVRRDVREIVKLAVSQAQKQNRLAEHTTFNRITTSNSNLDPFDGLYVGAFGPYGTEVVQLKRKFGHWNGANDESSDVEFFEYVEAVKLTGDLNVPAGQVTFRAKIGKASRSSNRGMYPDELGVVASYKGQGRIAEFGFRNPKWVDGELLQLSGKGMGPYVKGADLGFLYVIPEQSFLVLFNRLRLPE